MDNDLFHDYFNGVLNDERKHNWIKKKVGVNDLQLRSVKTICENFAGDHGLPRASPTLLTRLHKAFVDHFSQRKETKREMNDFKENQLFLSIVNDSRFAQLLYRLCIDDKRAWFNDEVYTMLVTARRENNLSASELNRKNVEQALWEHYKRKLDEEAERQQQHAYIAENYEQATTRATTRFNGPPQQLPKEPKTMTTPTFKTVTFVNGTPLSDLTDNDLIQAIKNCEKEIESLKEVKRTSTKVASKIAELEAIADKIRDALDAR